MMGNPFSMLQRKDLGSDVRIILLKKYCKNPNERHRGLEAPDDNEGDTFLPSSPAQYRGFLFVGVVVDFDMKRRKFIKTGLLGIFSTGIDPMTLLNARDCDTTHLDILGPYWSEDHPYRKVLANSNEPGTRVFISGTVKANDCETPIQNAIVDVWHANDNGCYTVFMECDSGNSDGDPYNLRGKILTDENGEYGFESIWPGYYSGRPRHFHYKITTPQGLELVTQCYFEGDPQINQQWVEDHPGQIIPLNETENALIGIFDINMDEEATELGVYDKTVTKKSILQQAYPNPFNNSTRIEFSIASPGHVSIGVYDITGKWITNIIENHLLNGTHSLNWRGLDANGNPVSSGSYLIVMKHAGYIASKKIVLLK